MQAAAAWAISPCIQNSEDSGDMVRLFLSSMNCVAACGPPPTKPHFKMTLGTKFCWWVGADMQSVGGRGH